MRQKPEHNDDWRQVIDLFDFPIFNKYSVHPLCSEMSLVHHKSSPVHDLIVKGMHSVAGTQVDAESNLMWQVTQSQESAAASTQGSILNFLVPAATPGLITLWNDSYVEVKGYFLNGAVVTVGTTQTTTIPALATGIFSDCVITWNGSVVRPASGSLTPYAVLCDTLVNETKTWVDNRDMTQGYIWDNFDDGGSQGVNAQARCTRWLAGAAAASNTRLFSLTIPLKSLGIRTNDAIPSGVEIRLQLTRNLNAFLTHGAGAAAVGSVLTLNSCRLFTRQIRLTQEASAALSMSLQKESARLNFQRVKMFSQAFPIGMQSIYVNQALPGPRPSRVMVGYIQQVCLTSAGANAYNVKTENGQVLSDIYLQIGDGRFYPTQSYGMLPNAAASTSIDFSEMYESYQSIARKDAAIPSSVFSTMNWLCFNTSRSGDCDGSVYDLSEECALDFHANVSAPPAGAFSIIMFSWTNGVIEIDAGGAVTVDV